MVLLQVSQFLDLAAWKYKYSRYWLASRKVVVEQKKKVRKKENGSDYRQKCAFFNKELWWGKGQFNFF